jgi:hypothetical protein
MTSAPRCVDWWKTDSRKLQPLGYKDKIQTYKEIYGFTKSELKLRQAAPRISPSFKSTPKEPVELKKQVENNIDDQSGYRAKAEASDSIFKLHSGGNAPFFLRSNNRPKTTPLHDLCSSSRLLTLSGLEGTMKRNPLAVNQVDSHHRTPLHWLMLNPRLNVRMLSTYLNFRDCSCQPGLQIVDSHGEYSALDYFMDAFTRIGRKEWSKCFQLLAKHSITCELLHTCDELFETDLKSIGLNRSALPLQKIGGRVNRIRCDGPPERAHYQGNPQMMSNQLREDRTNTHPDEITGFNLRSKSGTRRTIVGGEIGKKSVIL